MFLYQDLKNMLSL